MWKRKTNILEKNFKLILMIINKNITKAQSIRIDTLVWYFTITFVATVAIIFNMNEYMKYISIKYSIRSCVETNYAYQENGKQVKTESLNSAPEIKEVKNSEYDKNHKISNREIVDNEKKNTIDESNNWKMTSWWGETDKYK